MSLITDWREAVKTRLEGQLGAEYEVKGGPPDATFRQNQGAKHVVHVWWPGWDVLQSDIAWATPTLTIRVYPIKGHKTGDAVDDPASPATLEDAAVALMAAMHDVRKFDDLVDRLACYLTTVKPVTEPAGTWYVEAVLQGSTQHLAASAA